MSEEERFSVTVGKLERLLAAQRWIIGMTAAAVLWGARLEFASADHGQRLTGVEADVKTNGKDIAAIQGRLHGIATQVGMLPGKVAARLLEEEQQRRGDE